jgi:tRNA (cmo5U34)-methyltransferase
VLVFDPDNDMKNLNATGATRHQAWSTPRPPVSQETKTDQIFLMEKPVSSDFQFSEDVARVFDDMLVRSIPLYVEQQRMIRDMAAKFWIPGTDVYDLGCSTATTLLNLAPVIPDTGRLIGFDSSLPMLEQAREKIGHEKLSERIQIEYADLNGKLNRTRLENASVVLLCWTLQFVRPLNRSRLMRWIHGGLVEGGVLIVTEKILTNSPHMNRLFIDQYYDFKRCNNYSAEEIRRKREALENVLIPYCTAENLQLFRRSGFEVIETFFQWYNFAGYLCVKGRACGNENRSPAAERQRK